MNLESQISNLKPHARAIALIKRHAKQLDRTATHVETTPVEKPSEREYYRQCADELRADATALREAIKTLTTEGTETASAASAPSAVQNNNNTQER